jgi:hypothetical protein
MKKLIYFISIALMLISCKKDRLTKDKEIFVGKWKWVYTYKNGHCDKLFVSEFIYPQLNESYKIEFLKKGVVNFYKNNQKTNTQKIDFFDFKDSQVSTVKNSKYFDIRLFNNRKDDPIQMNGNISEDTLLIYDVFPLSDACYLHFNYFIRE